MESLHTGRQVYTESYSTFCNCKIFNICIILPDCYFFFNYLLEAGGKCLADKAIYFRKNVFIQAFYK